MNRVYSIPVALAAVVLLAAAPADARSHKKPAAAPAPAASSTTETAPTPTPAPEPAPTATPSTSTTETAGATATPPPPATDSAAPTPTPEAAVVQTAPASSPLRSLMVGVRIGATVAKPFNALDANFLAELELAYQFPVIQKRLGLFFDAGYTQPTLSNTRMDARVPGGSVTYDQTIRDVRLVLGLHFWQPLLQSKKLLFYAGVGATMHLTHTLINATSSGLPYGENTEDSTRGPGALVRLGVGYNLGPGALVFEVQGEYIGISHLITGGERDPESANTGTLAFQLGYEFFAL